MKHLTDLFPVVADKVVPPVLIVLGSPWPATQLVQALPGKEVHCFQMDTHQATVLRAKLAENEASAEVHVAADLWDLPRKFRTLIFPAAAYSDRDLKLDMVEQGFHILEDGGLFITLSEYEKDVQFAKWHKKVFGKCSESMFRKDDREARKFGSAFWSVKTGDQPRRRHEVTFHAKIGDGPSMEFASWPGTFSYGKMDHGSRAMLEVVQIEPGSKVVDMGCGNGSVGCLASPLAGPTGEITFVDSNARAVALTEKNAKANGVPNFKLATTSNLTDLGTGVFDVALANPPYYANSAIGRMFIQAGRDLLKPGGRFYLVTKMPVQTIPEVVETFGSVESVENRGYTVIIATV
jgi:16S rRNA G1207 methylase RsmC